MCYLNALLQDACSLMINKSIVAALMISNHLDSKPLLKAKKDHQLLII